MLQATECWVVEPDGSKVLRQIIDFDGPYVIVIGADGTLERVNLKNCEFRPQPSQILG